MNKTERAVSLLNFVVACIREIYDSNLLKEDEFYSLIHLLSNIQFAITEDYDRYLHKIVFENEIFNRRYVDYEHDKNASGR